jgi:HAD superfamily hydrolase (TIGR01509 family)
VFDCDGTLVNSEACWERAYVELFARNDREFSSADREALLGQPFEQRADILGRLLYQPSRAMSLHATAQALADAELVTNLAVSPGVVELLQSIQCRYPLAVASSSPRQHVLSLLRRTELLGAFAAVIGRDDVARVKPAPDVYLAACAALGTSPHDTIAIEDSLPGVTAALEAGLFVIGITSDAGINAHLRVSSLEDARIHALLVGRSQSIVTISRRGERTSP